MRDWDVFFETHSEPDVIGPAHETFLRRFTPNWVRRLAAELLTDRSYNNLSTREVFLRSTVPVSGIERGKMRFAQEREVGIKK